MRTEIVDLDVLIYRSHWRWELLTPTHADSGSGCLGCMKP